MDYPDSPARDGEVTVPADPSLLDTEDGNYEYLRDQLDGNRHPDKVPGLSRTSTRQPTTGKRARDAVQRASRAVTSGQRYRLFTIQCASCALTSLLFATLTAALTRIWLAPILARRLPPRNRLAPF
jgi:hypothetical protein